MPARILPPLLLLRAVGEVVYTAPKVSPPRISKKQRSEGDSQARIYVIHFSLSFSNVPSLLPPLSHPPFGRSVRGGRLTSLLSKIEMRGGEIFNVRGDSALC